MKKFATIALLSFCVLFSLSAKEDSFASFQWFNSKSLYRQSPTDVFNPSSTLEIMMIQSGQPRTVRVSPVGSAPDREYEDIPIFDGNKYIDETLYARLKTGVDVGLLRVGLFHNDAQLELAFSGALNTIFQGFGGADNLGFDGIFFFGPQLRLFDRVSLKFGLQHYSGHYGDETIENYYHANGEVLRQSVNFTRDNNLFFGIDVEPIKNLFFHVEATRPQLETWMSPSVHIPSWVIKPSNGLPLNPQEAGSENVPPPTTPYPDSYKAWTVQAGLSYDFYITKNLGLGVSGDVKMHQDGKTLHQVNGYSDANPWELEYTVGGGIILKDEKSNHKTRINFTYHDGRLPLLNYFYQRTSYISISAQIG
ncbi:MAG: hypothetical protein EOM67_04050 [Spirochaetia bacterium]|nr:hypothetical protein [Spirochaetia bacterium]